MQELATLVDIVGIVVEELVLDGDLACKDLRRLTCKPPKLVTNIDYCGFNYLEKSNIQQIFLTASSEDSI